MKVIVLFLLHQSTSLYFKRRELLTSSVHSQDNGEKFCKNCKFFKKNFFTETKYGHCSLFPNQPIDNNYLVDGYKDESPISYYYCSVARSTDRMCGPEGKYYEST